MDLWKPKEAGATAMWWTMQRGGRGRLTSGASAEFFSFHCREEPYLGAESTGMDSQQHPYIEHFEQ